MQRLLGVFALFWPICQFHDEGFQCFQPVFQFVVALFESGDSVILFPHYLMEPLDGGQGYPVSVQGSDVPLVLTQAEGGAEVLGREAHTTNRWVFGLVAPTLDGHFGQPGEYFLPLHRGEVLFGVAVGGIGPDAAVGQVGAVGGVNQVTAGSPEPHPVVIVDDKGCASVEADAEGVLPDGAEISVGGIGQDEAAEVIGLGAVASGKTGVARGGVLVAPCARGVPAACDTRLPAGDRRVEGGRPVIDAPSYGGAARIVRSPGVVSGLIVAASGHRPGIVRDPVGVVIALDCSSTDDGGSMNSGGYAVAAVAPDDVGARLTGLLPHGAVVTGAQEIAARGASAAGQAPVACVVVMVGTRDSAR